MPEPTPEKVKATQPFVWGCLGLTVLMLGFCSFIAFKGGGGSPESQKSFKGPGESGSLDSGGANVVVAVDEQAFDDYISAVVAKDEIGWRQQFSEGRIFLARKDTKVLVIEIGFTKKKVRILEGEHTGKAGWVPTEFVK